jgi:PAS domain S-box-containing protein
MSLRRKTIIILGLTILSLIAILFAVSQAILLNSFTNLENRETHIGLGRVLQSLDSELERLDGRAYDYAQAYGTKLLMLGKIEIEEYQSIPSIAVLQAQRIDFVIFVNPEGGIVYSESLDPITGYQHNLAIGIEEYLLTSGVMLQNEIDTSAGSGILVIPEGNIMLSSRPIHLEDEETVNGLVIVGEYITESELEKLSENNRLTISLYLANDPQLPEEVHSARTKLSIRQNYVVESKDKDSVAGYALLRDIHNKPSLILRVDMDRDTYKQGQASVTYFILSLLATSLIFGVVTLFVLEKYVLSRLDRLGKSVSMIGDSGSLSSRIVMAGNDELAELGREINKMLEELQQSERALRHSEERLKLAVDGANLGLWDQNLLTEEIEFSQKWLADLGYKVGIKNTKVDDWWDLIHPDDKPLVDARWEKHLSGETPVYEIEHRMRMQDGKWQWVFLSGKIIRNEHGKPLRLVGIYQSITKRKQMEEDLKRVKEAAEAANQAKSTFLANMSHELRTPLNAIIGYSEMLDEDIRDIGDNDLLVDLGKIRSAGRHLLELINDILDISKIEAGRMSLYLERFSVSSLVETVVATVQPMIEKNNNLLKVEMGENPVDMYGDMIKTRQILYNLLSNASKFTHEGSVDLRILSDDQWITFQVIDTGIGMHSDELGSIFQSFTQADASTTRKYGGTGLGLAISQRFCLMMGGEISVKSELGKGSFFSVRLPLVVKAPNVSSVGVSENVGKIEHPQVKLIDGQEKAGTVLIIDDDAAARKLVERSVTKENFHCVMAANGEDGLRLAKEVNPDIIILDVRMPGMNGWQVLSDLKSDPKLADIPVIMVTVDRDTEVGYALGALEYLVKPIEKQHLCSVLDRYKPAEKQGEGISPGHILLIDDDEMVRKTYVEALGESGWSISEAENGTRGLEIVAESPPDVILLDLIMPEMDGFQFIDKLRREPIWNTIPILLITSKDLTPQEYRYLSDRTQQIYPKGAMAHNRDEFLKVLRRYASENIGD